MANVDINVLATVVVAIVIMAIGAMWYAPSVFGKEWAALMGKKLKDLQGNAGPGYGVATVAALLQAFVLAMFVDYANATTMLDGLVVGFWVWLGFVGSTMAVTAIFAGQPRKLWMINTGYFLVSLVLGGAILATWR